MERLGDTISDCNTNENFAIAVFHFFIVIDSQKWTAVAWEAYTASSIVVTSHREDHSFQMTSALMKFLPLAVVRVSPVLKHGCLLNNLKLKNNS